MCIVVAAVSFLCMFCCVQFVHSLHLSLQKENEVRSSRHRRWLVHTLEIGTQCELEISLQLGGKRQKWKQNTL